MDVEIVCLELVIGLDGAGLGAQRLAVFERVRRAEIVAGREIPAGAAQDHDADILVVARQGETGIDLVEQAIGQRIAEFRAVHGDRRDAAGRGIEDVVEGHGAFSWDVLRTACRQIALASTPLTCHGPQSQAVTPLLLMTRSEPISRTSRFWPIRAAASVLPGRAGRANP